MLREWLIDLLGLDGAGIYRAAEREARLRIEARRQDPDASLNRSSSAVCRRIAARWRAEEIRLGRGTPRLLERVR